MPNLRSSLCTFPTALQETPNPVGLPLEHILLKGVSYNSDFCISTVTFQKAVFLHCN